ncbi:MAG: Hpt domain-containing protein [Planctomycetota bacterium]|nr:Hpt domain-containing protein [Planctomycetota bacterium]
MAQLPPFVTPTDAAREIALAIDRLGGHVELYKELVTRFLTDTAGTRRNLQAAVEKGDPDAIHRTAHSLKGLAASCGAMGVAHVLSQLESIGQENRMSDLPAAWEQFHNQMVLAEKDLAPYRNG